MDLSGKTLNELRTEFVVMGNELGVLAAKRKEYLDEIRNRVKKVSADARIRNMNDDEKEALRIALGDER